MAGEQSLAGRVAVITGAASGMGRVMARALAGAGPPESGVLPGPPPSSGPSSSSRGGAAGGGNPGW